MYRRCRKQPLTFFPKTEAEKRKGLAGGSGDPQGGHQCHVFKMSKVYAEPFLADFFPKQSSVFPNRPSHVGKTGGFHGANGQIKTESLLLLVLLDITSYTKYRQERVRL